MASYIERLNIIGSDDECCWSITSVYRIWTNLHLINSLFSFRSIRHPHRRHHPRHYWAIHRLGMYVHYSAKEKCVIDGISNVPGIYVEEFKYRFMNAAGSTSTVWLCTVRLYDERDCINYNTTWFNTQIACKLLV